VDAAQKRWLIRDAGVVTALVNAVLNWLPAWFAARDVEHVPLWSVPFVGTGVYTDTLGTFFLLPFLTTLFVTSAIWRDRREGRLAPGTLPVSLFSLAIVPSVRPARALWFACNTVALLAVPAAVLLAILAPDGLGHDAFIAYKTVLGVALGLVVTPLIAMAAMADPLSTPARA
jgi:hypothetical protein